MNNKVKIALGLLGGSLLLLALRRKNKKLKTFIAPDGNTYKENQMYRTYDDKLYKNGKQIHFSTPETGQPSYTPPIPHDEAKTVIPKNYQSGNKDVTYHQKGIRHH